MYMSEFSLADLRFRKFEQIFICKQRYLLTVNEKCRFLCTVLRNPLSVKDGLTLAIRFYKPLSFEIFCA